MFVRYFLLLKQITLRIIIRRLSLRRYQSLLRNIINLLLKKFFVLRQRRDKILMILLLKRLLQLISGLEDEPTEFDWLVNTTEKWCRDRAIYLALMESIQLADGKDETKDRDAIPSILSDALAVSFDTHIGHDYLQDYEERYELVPQERKQD